jgi:hypothetical protein
LQGDRVCEPYGVEPAPRLNAAIGWESFLSDWHIAAINRDSSAFVTELSKRVEQSLKDRWPGLAGRVALTIPKHPSLELVNDLIDPTGSNISFGDKDKWLARVNCELVDLYRAAVVALPDRDHLLIRAVVSIRDCIAHRSLRASNAMNDALANLQAADSHLRRAQARVTPSGIGAYLFAQAGGIRRVERYHGRLQGIAESLRVP